MAIPTPLHFTHAAALVPGTTDLDRFRWQTLWEQKLVVGILIDAELRILSISRGMREIWPEAQTGQNLATLVDPGVAVRVHTAFEALRLWGAEVEVHDLAQNISKVRVVMEPGGTTFLLLADAPQGEREQDALRKDLARFKLLAHKDPLTHLANRRTYDQFLQAEFDRVRLLGGDSSLALVDIDHFKRWNDTHGHAEGDQALQRVAEALERTVRRSDLVARIGGDEFAVVMPGAKLRSALQVARRMVAAIQGPDEGLTVSIGVAHAEPEMADEQAWKDAADAALYRAKEAGRNRAEAA